MAGGSLGSRPVSNIGLSSRVEATLVVCFFTLLGVAATWPLVRHLGDVIPGDLGDPLLNAWILGWDADRLKHGLKGLWDAPNFYPYVRTLAFSEHLLGIAVWTAPLVWLRGGSPIVAYNVAVIASFPLAGAGAYLLGRELTGRRSAALVTGVAFTFCQARLPHLTHLQLLWTGWTPLMLWALHRYFATGARVMLAAFAFFWLEQTASNLYTLFLTLPPLLALAAYGLWHSGKECWRRFGELAVTGGLMLATFAPVALVYRGVREMYGLRRSTEDIQHYGADLGAWLHGSLGIVPYASVAPSLFRQIARPEGPEGELFPGLAILVLALAGMALAARRRGSLAAAPVYLASAAAALLLSLGAAPTAWGSPLPLGGPYRLLYEHAPGFDGLRVPARFATMVQLSLAVLAGSALLWLPRGRRSTHAVAAVAVLLMLAEGVPRSIPLPSTVEAERGNRIAYRWLRTEAPGPLLELPTGDDNMLGFIYQYRSLAHGQPLMNGRSGYNSIMQNFYGGPASPLMEFERFEEGVRALRDIGITTIAVHPSYFKSQDLATAVVDHLRAARPQVIDETRFEDMLVFRLAPSSDLERAPLRPLAPEHAIRKVPAEALQITANQDSERVPRMIDADADTRWFSDGAQSGREIVEIALDRARPIARLRFETSERSNGDYPRDLQVEGVGPDGQTRLLFRGNPLRLLVDGIRRDPARSPVDIWLPAHPTSRLILRQVGSVHTWQWSIDELSVWESSTPEGTNK